MYLEKFQGIHIHLSFETCGVAFRVNWGTPREVTKGVLENPTFELQWAHTTTWRPSLEDSWETQCGVSQGALGASCCHEVLRTHNSRGLLRKLSTLEQQGAQREGLVGMTRKSSRCSPFTHHQESWVWLQLVPVVAEQRASLKPSKQRKETPTQDSYYIIFHRRWKEARWQLEQGQPTA